MARSPVSAPVDGRRSEVRHAVVATLDERGGNEAPSGRCSQAGTRPAVQAAARHRRLLGNLRGRRGLIGRCGDSSLRGRQPGSASGCGCASRRSPLASAPECMASRSLLRNGSRESSTTAATTTSGSTAGACASRSAASATSRSPLSRRFTVGNSNGPTRAIDVAKQPLADRAGDLGIARVKPRERIAQRLGIAALDRPRHAEGRGVDGAERRDRACAPARVGDGGLPRNSAASSCVADHARHQDGTSRKPRPKGVDTTALRPVTRRNHPPRSTQRYATRRYTYSRRAHGVVMAQMRRIVFIAGLTLRSR